MTTLRIRAAAIALSAAFSCASCATMLKGTHEEIMVSSDPAAADVSINGEQSGKTPFTTTVPSSRNLQIQLTKAGYQEQTVTDDATFRWGYEIWSFICWVIPLGVDMADGAAWGHQQTMIAAHLEPVAVPVAQANQAQPQTNPKPAAAPSPGPTH